MAERTTLDLVRGAIEDMPAPVAKGARTEITRFAYEADLVLQRVAPGSTVCDIGAGWGVLGLVLAAAGMRVILLDDFGDSGFQQPVAVAVRETWKQYGLEVVNRDPGRESLGFPTESLDAITTFGCIEHWHSSPKHMLQEAVHALRPQGLMVIGTPNSSNLRKRLSAVLGCTQWSAMEDWYEKEVFRGHVREPNVPDLLYIARDIGLQRVEVAGRNFAGTDPSQRWWVRAVTPVVDGVLRLRPNLCSNIYLLGYRP